MRLFLPAIITALLVTVSAGAAETARETAAKPRIIVLTDISNEPDDEESLVRFLVYANEFDVEALIATTSTHLKNGTREDLIRRDIEAYGQGAGESAQARAELSRSRRVARRDKDRPTRIRHGGGRRGEKFGGLAAHCGGRGPL